MNRKLKYALLGTALAATALTTRQVTRQIDENNLLMNAAGQAASGCVQSMIGSALHGTVYDKFPKCDAQTVTLPNGMKATIAFDDNLRFTDGSGKYSLYEYIWGNNPRSGHVTWPADTAVQATMTVEGNKSPVMAEARFDAPATWGPATLDF